ncbi:MAG: HlyD family secretion protein [Cyclobacteriaceae bacterium]
MLKRYLFFLFWLAVMVVITTMATMYRDGREAMVAEVESRVAAVSLPVVARIDSIYVIPGQTVRKGDPLVKISRPDLDLKIRKAQYGLQLAHMDSLRQVEQYQKTKSKLQLDYEQEVQVLAAKKQVLELEKTALTKEQQLLSKFSSKGVQEGLTIIALKLEQLKDQEQRNLKEWETLSNLNKKSFNTEQRLNAIQIQEELLKLEELKMEKEQLVQYAPFDGTVGPINVELQEITEPHDKLVSIFESKPSLIKAYTKENQTALLRIGQKVKVTATNRVYEINGTIESMGSRVTSYPVKINPNPNGQSYGQEVFVRISPDNNFLKGEKVYVYAVEK